MHIHTASDASPSLPPTRCWGPPTFRGSSTPPCAAGSSVESTFRCPTRRRGVACSRSTWETLRTRCAPSSYLSSPTRWRDSPGQTFPSWYVTPSVYLCPFLFFSCGNFCYFFYYCAPSSWPSWLSRWRGSRGQTSPSWYFTI